MKSLQKEQIAQIRFHDPWSAGISVQWPLSNSTPPVTNSTEKSFCSISCAIDDKYLRFLTIWRMPDHCLTTTWQLPDNCLATTWQLLENCLTTAWQLPDNCLTTTAWQPQSVNNCVPTTVCANSLVMTTALHWQITYSVPIIRLILLWRLLSVT